MSLSELSGRTLKSGPFMQFVLQRILGGLAATFLLVLMLITLVDVVGRYGFNSPVNGSFEIRILLSISLMLLCRVFLRG